MILVHNDLTKDPTSRNFVHIEVHTQLHSATRGSLVKVNSVPAVQVTWLLPSLTASELEQVTSTTVPVSTGNCVVVLIVPVHSVFSPVHIGAVEVFNKSE